MNKYEGCRKRQFEREKVNWVSPISGKMTPDFLLDQMWREGVSAKRIAAHLNTVLPKGQKCSLTMVYDRARVLNLPLRASPIKAKAA